MRILFPLSPYNQQRQFEKPVWVYPAHLAMYATFLLKQGHEVIWGGVDDGSYDKVVETDEDIGVAFDMLPYPDRVFTDAMNPRWQAYGNYKFHPATHMMVSNLCWYKKCTFCVDTLKAKTEARAVRSVDHVIAEIDNLIELGYKEVFDDSGTFPVGKWLDEFSERMQTRKKFITLGCNMKPIDNKRIYKRLKDAGMRFVLVGIESANQVTLDRIKKSQKAHRIVPIMRQMTEAGLDVHLTAMFGYDWETHEDAMNTVRLVHHLLKEGYIKTAQASVFSPPRRRPDPESPGHKYVSMIYDVAFHPKFMWRKITEIRSFNDVKYYLRGARLVLEEKWRKFVGS